MPGLKQVTWNNSGQKIRFRLAKATWVAARNDPRRKSALLGKSVYSDEKFRIIVQKLKEDDTVFAAISPEIASRDINLMPQVNRCRLTDQV